MWRPLGPAVHIKQKKSWAVSFWTAPFFVAFKGKTTQKATFVVFFSLSLSVSFSFGGGVLKTPFLGLA